MTYRERSSKYGHGTASGNEPCPITSPAPEILTPSVCFYCGTTRGDPLLPRVSKSLADGYYYYRMVCGGDRRYEQTGSSGFISRSPSLYGLYLQKVQFFFDMHENHATQMEQEIDQGDIPYIPHDPLVMHIHLYGSELEYDPFVIAQATAFINEIETNLYDKGLYLPQRNYPEALKKIQNICHNFLKKKPNWSLRREILDMWQDESNKTAKKNLDLGELENVIDFPITPGQDETLDQSFVASVFGGDDEEPNPMPLDDDEIPF